MLQYLSPLKSRLKKGHHHTTTTTTTADGGDGGKQPTSSPAVITIADAPPAPLTPLLAPTDERFLASVIDPEGEGEGEGVHVILPGSALGPGAATGTGTGTGTVTPGVAVVDVADDAAAAAAVGGGGGGGGGGTGGTGEPAWKEELRSKWGYLGSLKDASVTRLGQFVGVGESEGGAGAGAGAGDVAREGKEGKKVKEKKEKVKEKVKDVKGKGKEKEKEKLQEEEVGPQELLKEDADLTTILDTLSLSASQGRILSLSNTPTSLKPLIAQFTQILKDLLAGVPTAYDDLITLFTSSSTLFQKTYDSLPSFLKQMIATLPDKLKPEVLRTLAATSPVVAEKAASLSGIGLKELVTTPGVLADLLRSVVAALRLRFPMLMGGGVAVGLGVFVVLFGLWYCYKRGVETREEREERERMERFGVERIMTEEEVKRKEEEEKAAAAAAAAAEAAGTPAGAEAEKKKKKWWK